VLACTYAYVYACEYYRYRGARARMYPCTCTIANDQLEFEIYEFEYFDVYTHHAYVKSVNVAYISITLY
jgi:hypothetical protein